MILNRVKLLHGLAMLGCFAAAPAPGAEQDALPEDAFLEFLGGFETADGDWVDPMSLAGLDSSDAQFSESDAESGSGEEETRGEDEDES